MDYVGSGDGMIYDMVHTVVRGLFGVLYYYTIIITIEVGILRYSGKTPALQHSLKLQAKLTSPPPGMHCLQRCNLSTQMFPCTANPHASSRALVRQATGHTVVTFFRPRFLCSSRRYQSTSNYIKSWCVFFPFLFSSAQL